MTRRLQRTKEGRNIPVYYYGDKFESMRDLAKHLELTVNQIKWALTDRYNGEIINKEISHILESNFIGSKCYIVFDKPFYSIGEMSEAFGVKENIIQMIYFRNKDRYSFEEELIKRMITEPITFKGVEYESLSILCSKYGVDYPTFIRRFRYEKKSMEEALFTPIMAVKGQETEFRGNHYLSIRELYNAFGYSRSLDSHFKNNFPQFNSIQVFDWYLQFLDENELEPSEEMITTVPMVYYEGTYYNRAITFYNEVGITSRNVGHEKKAKENIGLELERIILNMSTRINKHNGEQLFPNCTINPDGRLLFLKKRFEEYVMQKNQ